MKKEIGIGFWKSLTVIWWSIIKPRKAEIFQQLVDLGVNPLDAYWQAFRYE